MTRMLAMLKLFLLVVMALCAGCASAPRPPAYAALFDDTAFGRPTTRTDAADLFALSPAMESFHGAEIAPMVRVHGPQRGLFEALYTREKLRLLYDTAYTRNAAEAFDARAGNCLSLVIMTAAFAKRLGLDIRYQRVNVDDVWARGGDLVEVIGHVNLALGRPSTALHRTQSPSDWITIDFVSIDDNQRHRFRTLEESRVVAMYMNNKSVEALIAGKPDDAYWWSRASIERDPLYAGAYITLGVVMRRHGKLERAEAAFRTALQLEPANPQALSNQVGVLKALGRESEASAAAQLLDRLQPSTPLTAYRNGLAALKTGHYSQARDAFRQALRNAPDDHEFHYMLAVAYLKLGDGALALEHLRKAHDASPKGERRAAYESKLGELQRGGPKATR